MTTALAVRRACPSEIPTGSRVLCVGEAPGKNEDIIGRPFIGPSGRLLRWALRETGLHPAGLTNVLPWRPPANNLQEFCVRRAELHLYNPPEWLKNLPTILPARQLLPEYAVPALNNLRTILEELQPLIVLALGNTACWALLHDTGIERLGGTVHWCKLVPGVKVIPTYHPAAILRQWKLLPTFLADLIKAEVESQTSGIEWPERYINIQPSLRDVEVFLGACMRSEMTSVDVETMREPGPHITCCGFAYSSMVGMVVPFYDPWNGKPQASYWTPEEEFQVWKMIKTLLEAPCGKVFHNCLYDLQWLHSMGMNPRNAYHDTMLMAHALWPEMRKRLRDLGRIWSRERAWKHLRTTTKRDD